jgi:O-antigen/teichoic acid export membrane protein
LAEVTVKNLARNSAVAMIEQVWRIGSRIIITPMILHRMSLEGYGVWTLLFTICAYVSAIDVNFGVAYKKFTAELDAQRNYQRLSELVGAGMMLVGSIAAVALTVIWLLRETLLRALNVPEAMLADAGQALLVVSLCVVMRMSVGCTFAIIAGLQRTDLRNLLSILASLVEFTVSIVLLIRGWKLLGLALGHLSGQVVSTAAAWVICRRLCPRLSISPLRATRSGLRTMLSMGGRFQLLAVMQLIINKGTKLFCAALLGVYYLGIIEVADKLIRLGVAVGSGVLAPVMPAFSNLRARGDERRLRGLMERGSKMVAAICLPTFCFLAVFADRLIELWCGQAYPLAAWTVRMIAPVAYLSMLTGIGTSSLRAEGNIRIELNYALVGAGVLALLYYPGYRWLGYHGMIGVEFLAGSVAAGWFFVVFARRQESSFRGVRAHDSAAVPCWCSLRWRCWRFGWRLDSCLLLIFPRRGSTSSPIWRSGAHFSR